MKYIVIKEFLEYKIGDIIVIAFSTFDLDIFFISLADWREQQINSILEDE